MSSNVFISSPKILAIHLHWHLTQVQQYSSYLQKYCSV